MARYPGVLAIPHLHTAICMTPKIGFSETLDYVRWTVEGPQYACNFGPTYVRNATTFCSTAQLHRNQTRYARLNTKHLFFCQPGQTLRQCGRHQWGAANITMAILIRDPWDRLLSAYRSKFMGDHPALRVLMSSTMNRISAFAGQNVSKITPLCQYLHYIGFQQAVVGYSSASRSINSHLMPQTASCLHESVNEWHGNATKCIAIDKGHGFDTISELLGLNGSMRFSNIMVGKYSTQIGDYSHKMSFIHECCNISKTLARHLDDFLTPDYLAMAQQCNVIYEHPRLSMRNVSQICANKNMLY